jgi:hypothetical protein
MAPSVRDYYEKVLAISPREIAGTPDTKFVAMDPEQWTDYFVKKHGMEPVEIDAAHPMTMVEARHGNGLYVVQPMIWTRTMEIISQERLAGAPQWMAFDYGDFFNSEHPRCLSLITEPLPQHVEYSQRRIKEYAGGCWLSGVVGQTSACSGFVVAFVSAVASDNLGYWLGRRYGRAGVERYPVGC